VSDQEISLWHPLRSLRVLLTESTSPRELALAGSLGVFLGTLPLVGFHTLAIIFSAQMCRLNKVAAVGASQLCMPPLVPALCIEAGYFMRHGDLLTQISLQTLGYEAMQRLWEYCIGSVILAPLLAVLIGALIYIVAITIRRRA
jgi:uncharacterized protein (DUF2062 family)